MSHKQQQQRTASSAARVTSGGQQLGAGNPRAGKASSQLAQHTHTTLQHTNTSPAARRWLRALGVICKSDNGGRKPPDQGRCPHSQAASTQQHDTQHARARHSALLCQQRKRELSSHDVILGAECGGRKPPAVTRDHHRSHTLSQPPPRTQLCCAASLLCCQPRCSFSPWQG